MTRPVGIDLFGGVGGLSLGFEQAGFDIAATVEVDPVHAAAHKFNFPYSMTLPRSVVGLSGDELRRLANAGSRPVDVVFGGAPCQGFSLIGQRALDDPRNALVGEFVRLVAELDTKFFVFENVKGLTIGKHRQFLEELVGALRDRGYRVRTPWQVLNAAHFGVPQNRERLFLIGARSDMPLPEYPKPLVLGAGPDSSPGPRCQDALEDLPEAEAYSELRRSDEVQSDAWGSPSPYAEQMRCVDDDAWRYGYRREWDSNLLTASARTAHTAISRRRFAETPPGTVEPVSRLFKLSRRGLSNTLRAGTDSARGAFTSPRPIHYAKPRCVTVREMARLHGFPDWFRFHRTKWHGARQIGNSVPPPLARAVAACVLQAADVRPTRPDTTLRLGDTDLLRMNMSEASQYWGVPVPIGRRDRKSGARKRKQEDIEASLVPTPRRLFA